MYSQQPHTASHTHNHVNIWIAFQAIIQRSEHGIGKTAVLTMAAVIVLGGVLRCVSTPFLLYF